jgi:two-component system phosphate regulon sensor histidine kinase PhoR
MNSLGAVWLAGAITCALVTAAALLWRRQQFHFRTLTEQSARLQRELDALGAQHQQSAAAAEARMQALFNNMTEGVLVLDSSGRIQLINQAAQNFFKVTNNVHGLTVLEAFRMHQLAALTQQAALEGRIAGYELELPGWEGQCVEINAASYWQGDQKQVILAFHDLTRLRKLENTRQEFVANVSHELRTPLSLIKGYVETLRDGASADPAVAARFLEIIEKHVNRLSFLIEDLLTVSQLESGKLVLNLQPMVLRDVMSRVLDDLAGAAASRQVQLHNRVPPGLEVNADADRLQQVLFNLVENAIKYGRASGKVTIETGPSAQGMVEVLVTDDGPGIPPPAVGRVFERFFRVDRARSRESGGTGLGLAIVKHIVQAHGGEVGLRSEVGHGSTFHFTIPLAEPLPSTAAPALDKTAFLGP